MRLDGDESGVGLDAVAVVGDDREVGGEVPRPATRAAAAVVAEAQVGGASAFQEGMVAPGQRQALVAQPDGNGQCVQDGAVVGALFHGADSRLGDPHRGHAAHGAAARHHLLSMTVMHRQLERGAPVRQAVDGA